jgi:diphthamide biosynthesis enzyme Dph1/Dph2-like protein
MKTLFIETRRKLENPELNPNIDASKLPSEIFLAYSIQYKQLAEQIKEKIQKAGRKVKGFQQVLGCTKLQTKFPILLIGSGRFHALNLALQNKEVYIYNNSIITKISEKETEELKKRKIASFSKFLHSTNIGIIVSTKPGQNNLNKAKSFIEQAEKKYPEKRFYLFFSNNINIAELENFQADIWVNTACPGLIYDSPKLVNIDDIFPFL